jgi:hypothetical protein
VSASEKLRAIDGKFAMPLHLGMPLTVMTINYWPQIVAVVEAAENVDELMVDDGEDPDAELFGLRLLQMAKALRALDWALDE